MTKLTKRTVDTAKPEGRDYFLWDTVFARQPALARDPLDPLLLDEMVPADPPYRFHDQHPLVCSDVSPHRMMVAITRV